jgi:hypothetical protein
MTLVAAHDSMWLDDALTGATAAATAAVIANKARERRRMWSIIERFMFLGSKAQEDARCRKRREESEIMSPPTVCFALMQFSCEKKIPADSKCVACSLQ